MLKKAEQDIGTFSQASKTLVQTATDFCFGVEDCIFHIPFDIAMTILFWIQFWRICWQIFHIDVSVFFQIFFDQQRLMCTRLIPDQDERLFDVTLEMLQTYQ